MKGDQNSYYTTSETVRSLSLLVLLHAVPILSHSNNCLLFVESSQQFDID